MFKIKPAKQASYGLALIFAIIALTGVFMIFSGSNEKAKILTQKLVATADSTTMQPQQRTESGGYIFRVFWVTAILILFIYFTARYLKKYKLTHGLTGRPGIEVISKHNFGPKQFIVLIKAEDKKLLLGVTEHSINVLADLGPVEKEEPGSESNNESTQNKNFSGILSRLQKDN